MDRRNFVVSVLGLSGAAGGLGAVGAEECRGVEKATHAAAPGRDLDNPYSGVEWGNHTYLHSMSHQHQGQNDSSRDVFYAMGYRHFAFSNYYPSAPTPVPDAYLRTHPDVIGAPNAEQHSFVDSGLHFNGLGSRLSTGHGSSLSSKELSASPLRHRFEGLNLFNAERRPWLGVYRLDVRLTSRPGQAGNPGATLTIDGAVECDPRASFAPKGPVRDRPVTGGSIYLRTTSTALETLLRYDPDRTAVTQFRLMQGTNRPWRDVFRAALDGEGEEGGLLFPDGGGITLNHPTGKVSDYLPMLDFDPRVLGIEVWNELTTGFGAPGGFYNANPGPHLHFYQLWDEILRTGRRCWGFFVKDHRTFARGRNVLLVPNPQGRTREQRERDALVAYRRGAFFGLIGSLATNEKGEVAPPYDQSNFRFREITVRRDREGRPTAVRVSVTGHDRTRRPNVQIRFVTDRGIEKIVDRTEAEFPLERNGDGTLRPLFVRIEAFAYPSTHRMGEPLTPVILGRMDVSTIAQLHDRKATTGPEFFGGGQQFPAPIPIVDMLFSQPLRRV